MGGESNGAGRDETGRRGPRPRAPRVLSSPSSVARPAPGLPKGQFPARPSHVWENPRGGAPRPARAEQLGATSPREIPAPSVVANPSGPRVPDEDGEPGGLRAHLPREQRGKAKPGALVSPRGKQEQHGHLHDPETGTETPPPARAPRLPGLFCLSTPVCLHLHQSRAGPAAAETRDPQGARAPAVLKITAAC